MRETGLEPVRRKHTPLKRARLPIPPLSLGTLHIIADAYTVVNTFFEVFLKIFEGQKITCFGVAKGYFIAKNAYE